ARVIGVVAHQRGHVEGGAEPGLALGEEILETFVGVLGPAEAREHAHGPELAAVHRRIGPARVGELARIAERVLAAPARQIRGRVERTDGDARERLVGYVALGRAADERPVRLLLPAFLAVGHVSPLGYAFPLRKWRAMTSFWICDVPS